ncbi:MAG TPA: TlpA disulfide reductase family protein [bacterium]|nr:TlpA disulfide reductase family protein [bacterium]
MTHHRPRPIRRAGLLIALLATALAVTAAAADTPSPLLGKRAPLLSGRAAFGAGLINLQRLQNEIVYEKDAQGKPVREGNRIKVHIVRNAVVLNFFATYCAPCVREIPTFNRIAKSYEGRPVKFVYVNVDTEKTADQVREFARSKGIAVEMILPSVRYAVQAYRIDALPRIVVIDRKGIVTHVVTGFQEDLAKQLGEVLAPVLAQPDPGAAPLKRSAKQKAKATR